LFTNKVNSFDELAYRSTALKNGDGTESIQQHSLLPG